MKRAILTHRRDFAAVTVMLLLALASAAYILGHQPAFTLLRSFYVVRADFATAAAVSPGQGEAVTIAGVPVGTVGAVTLEHGHAVVTMDIDPRYGPIYRDATVLLRQRTPLKDMYLSLDPGTPTAGRIPNGGSLGLAETQPDVNVDQILSSLDADTRSYLLLALSGGAQALSGSAPESLRAVFRRFPPLLHSTATFTGLLARRTHALARAIHNLDLVAGALGGVNTQLGGLIDASNRDFGAIASQDRALSGALAEAPATLATTQQALGQVARFGAAAAPALVRLEPVTHTLAPALAALVPLARGTRTEISHILVPFSTTIQPVSAHLDPAAARLAAATPELSSGLAWINQLLNGLAHRPSSGNSYLFWGSWLAHNANSVLSLQDANGAVVRGLFLASCPALNLLQTVLSSSQPSIGALLTLLGEPQAASLKSPYCPPAA
ncbi:MAG TPA: MlaD family protein [Solirubrobacteraceae bacterium]|nr:MlaD family protein [Solirubrobacteraceae bacterium]